MWIEDRSGVETLTLVKKIDKQNRPPPSCHTPTVRCRGGVTGSQGRTSLRSHHNSKNNPAQFLWNCIGVIALPAKFTVSTPQSCAIRVAIAKILLSGSLQYMLRRESKKFFASIGQFFRIESFCFNP
jgi:hypothetical protein